ncbi:MAG: hypothetical protein ACK4OO_07425 [bacterium]
MRKGRVNPEEKLWKELVEVAEKLYPYVRYDEGFFLTGTCHFRGNEWLVINTRQPLGERITALAHILKKSSWETIYLKPALRDKIRVLTGEKTQEENDEELW